MDPGELRPRTPIDAFAWQYAFFTQLIYRGAPAPEVVLSDVAHIFYLSKGHLCPEAAAAEALMTWPFELKDVCGDERPD